LIPLSYQKLDLCLEVLYTHQRRREGRARRGWGLEEVGSLDTDKRKYKDGVEYEWTVDPEP
jgi:hypothetical protein